MPVILKQAEISYNDNGIYKGINTIAQRSTAQMISQVQAAGAESMAVAEAAADRAETAADSAGTAAGSAEIAAGRAETAANRADAAVAILPEDLIDLLNDMAEPYSTVKIYDRVGEYALFGGQIYKRIKVVQAAEDPFDPTKWEAVDVGNELSMIQAITCGTLEMQDEVTLSYSFVDGNNIVSSSTGAVETNNNGFKATKLIDVSAFSSVIYSRCQFINASVGGIAFYDKDGVYTTGYVGVQSAGTYGYIDTTITIPANAKYMRLTSLGANASGFYIKGIPKINTLQNTVRYDIHQILTTTQRKNVRDNIDAPSNIELDFGLSNKQDKLTFDDTPTTGSNNPVKSGGVKSAIDAVAGNIPDIIVNSTAQEKTAIRTAIGAENGSDIIKIQDTQPTEPATKIWIPETMPQGIQVPTQTEFEELSDRVTEVLTWISEVDDNFKTGDDDLLKYSKSTHRIPLTNNEHRTIVDQDDGGIYVNSDGQERGIFYFYNDTSHLPAWFIPGQTYRLEYEGVSGIDTPFRIYIYPDGKTSDSYAQNILWANHSCVFTTPQNMTGLSMRIHYDITNVPFEHTFYPKLYLLNAPMEPEMSFDYDPVTIPQEVIGWQDFEKVGNHIWMFTASNDNHTTADGLIDILDTNWTYIKSIPHNIGHCNTVSYDVDTDSLLVTSCVIDNETITIFKNVSQWESLNTIDYTNVDKIVIDLSDLSYNMGYNNACWGEKKRDGFRYIYVASSNGTMWTKLELATENEYYTSTYTVLWQIGCDRNTVSGINTSQVIQGMTFYNGKIYGSISHNPIHGVVYTFTQKKAKREIIHIDGTGLVEGNEGCMIMDGKLYLGCSSWTGAESAPVVVKVQILGAISN